jgi:hypothetical protein
MIDVVRTEERRRLLLLTGENLDSEHDRWLYTDEPFVNELCLMALVALGHQVERELVGLAARASGDANEISPAEYRNEVQKLRTDKGWKWQIIESRLKTESWNGYTSMEVLRKLANLYKHEPSREPDSNLLNLLNLAVTDDYARLQESDALREGLAISVNLGKNVGYCDIVERFVEIAKGFLADGQSRTKIRALKRVGTSLIPRR